MQKTDWKMGKCHTKSSVGAYMFLCDICLQPCSLQVGLYSHKKTHKMPWCYHRVQQTAFIYNNTYFTKKKLNYEASTLAKNSREEHDLCVCAGRGELHEQQRRIENLKFTLQNRIPFSDIRIRNLLKYWATMEHNPMLNTGKRTGYNKKVIVSKELDSMDGCIGLTKVRHNLKLYPSSKGTWAFYEVWKSLALQYVYLVRPSRNRRYHGQIC